MKNSKVLLKRDFQQEGTVVKTTLQAGIDENF